MEYKEPEIAPTVSFRHPALNLSDNIVSEERSGFVEQDVPKISSDPFAVLPPPPQCEAPRTSLSARLRERLERGGK